MALVETTTKFKEKVTSGSPLGNSVKFVLGGEGVIYLNGTDNAISNEDKEADCTVNVSHSDFNDMLDGSLNPMNAFMGGKMQIEGDMGVAMKLSSLFA